VVFLALGLCGTASLKQILDFRIFLERGSYVSRFITTLKEDFPDKGARAEVFIGQIEDEVALVAEMDELIGHLNTWIENGKYLEGFFKKNLFNFYNNLIFITVGFFFSWKAVDAWTPYLKRYARNKYKTEWNKVLADPSLYRKFLSSFLFHPQGMKYQKSVAFNGNLTCGEKSPHLIVSHEFLSSYFTLKMKPFYFRVQNFPSITRGFSAQKSTFQL